MHTCSLVHDSPFYNEIEIQAHMQKKILHWSGLLCFSYSFTYKQNKETATCFLQEITHPTQSRQTFLAFFYYIWQVLHLHRWSSFQQLASCSSGPLLHSPNQTMGLPFSHLHALSRREIYLTDTWIPPEQALTRCITDMTTPSPNPREAQPPRGNQSQNVEEVTNYSWSWAESEEKEQSSGTPAGKRSPIALGWPVWSGCYSFHWN